MLNKDTYVQYMTNKRRLDAPAVFHRVTNAILTGMCVTVLCIAIYCTRHSIWSALGAPNIGKSSIMTLNGTIADAATPDDVIPPKLRTSR